MGVKNNENGYRLVLASASPRRHELLTRLGIRFEVAVSQIDETGDFRERRPRDVAMELALLKARDIGTHLRKGFVLGADTVIDHRGEVLGKPETPQHAFEMLRRLVGETHEVITAVSLFEPSTGKDQTRFESTRVRMREASDFEIQAYVESAEPMDKAGSYAIQGLGETLVESIEGCYNNVVGLPLCLVCELLTRSGFALTGASACRLPSGEPCPQADRGVCEDDSRA